MKKVDKTISTKTHKNDFLIVQIYANDIILDPRMSYSVSNYLKQWDVNEISMMDELKLFPRNSN